VSAELVDAVNQQTLWSDQYDRELAGVLDVQSDIALEIARALHASLSAHERKRLEQRPTENLEAYTLYLQAQQMGSLTDRARTLTAMGLLRKALALDPRFAAAQAWLGYRLIFMGYYDDASYVDKGIAEVLAALRIDPSLPVAYFALGTGYSIKGMEAQGRQAFLRALELDPNNTPAMQNFSVAEAMNGRLDEALYWGRRSFGLSGKRANDYYHLILPMLNLRADASCRTLLEHAERRFPDSVRLQILLALLELVDGQVERSASRTHALVARAPQNEEAFFHRADVAFLTDAPDLEQALEPLMQHGASSVLSVAETVRLRYAYVLAKRGESTRAATLVAEAERIAREKIDAGNQTPALRIELAAAAVLRDDTSAALDWLTRAHDEGYRDYGFLERDPILAKLGAQPRLRDVLDRMRRDVEAQRARARERGLLEIDLPPAPVS
jgi:cell division septum initiation protein DivIVA